MELITGIGGFDMLLHTIVSMEDIFATNSAADIKTEKINGGHTEYEKVNGEYKLRRLISTDPAMYLKKQYQPSE